MSSSVNADARANTHSRMKYDGNETKFGNACEENKNDAYVWSSAGQARRQMAGTNKIVSRDRKRNSVRSLYSRRYRPVKVTMEPPHCLLSSTSSHAPTRCILTRHCPSSPFSNGVLPSSAKAIM